MKRQKIAFVLADRYRILQKISEGRVSSIYKARDEETDISVALRIMEITALVTAADRRQALSSFERETERLRFLHHPGLAPILDYFVERDTAHLVTAWIDGCTLHELYQQGPLPESQVREIGVQIADALAYLHAQQPPLLLRDLKMSHVIVNDSGKATIIDLGLGRFFKAGQARGTAERGTAPYEAPEQEMYQYASPRSDIYALGTLLLALIKGPGSSRNQASASPEMRKALARARQKDPNRRYSSVIAFRKAIQGGHYIRIRDSSDVPPAFSLLTKSVRIEQVPGKKDAAYRVRVRNTSEEPVEIIARSSVAWLAPRQERLTIPAGEIGELLIIADVAATPKAPRSEARAIAIEDGAGNRAWVAADITEPAPQLSIETENLNFGQLGDEPISRSVHVANAGGGVIELNISTPYGWLQLSRHQVRLAGGQSFDLAVSLIPDEVPQAGDFSRAILLDSDQSQQWIGINFSKGEPKLEVVEGIVDFGDVHFPEEGTTKLVVGNRGSASLALSVRAASKHISVEPSSLTIPPMKKTYLTVTLRSRECAPGPLLIKEALQFQSDGGATTRDVQAAILRPILAVSERELDFGSLTANGLRDAKLTLVISNRGNVPLDFSIDVQVPWIYSWPLAGKLASGGSTLVAVSLTDAADENPGQNADNPALVISSDAGVLPVAARYFLIKPIMHVEPVTLDFGLIPEASVKERHVSLANLGTGKLDWQTHTDATWLEVTPASGSLLPDDAEEVVIRAYAMGLPAEAQQGRAVVIFAGAGHEIVVNATVAISHPLLVVDPVLEFGRSEDYQPTSGRLLIFNRGVGELTAHIESTVPWVSLSKSTVTVPSGGSKSLDVYAAPPESLGLGRTNIPAAINIESNGGSAEVEITLEITSQPKLEIVPDRLVLKQGTEGVIIVRNIGLSTFIGGITSSSPKVGISPELLTIRPNRRARVKVSAVEQSEVIEQEQITEVQINSGDWKRKVEVIVAE